MFFVKTEQELIKQLNDSYKTGLDDGKTVGRNEVLRNIAEPVSLRDQFAMASLSGFIGLYGNHFDTIAESAYDLADALLEVRSEKYKQDIEQLMAERAKRG